MLLFFASPKKSNQKNIVSVAVYRVGLVFVILIIAGKKNSLNSTPYATFFQAKTMQE